jgi:hypothetical protein
MITRFGPDQVLVHFDTEANRRHELQYRVGLQCPTNAPGCASNAWRTIYVVHEPVPNHYIIPHRMTNQAGFYRLRVTP